jgi:hypothetical protein
MAKPAFTVTIKKAVDNKKKLRDALGRFRTNPGIDVGVPGGSPRQGGKITNAELAYIHENGAPEVGILARPFLRPTIKANKRKIAKALKDVAKFAFNGRRDLAERRLNILGIDIVDAVKRYIEARIPPPLRPATIKARRRRGIIGTTPLVDTGQLLRSIGYVIRKGR